MKQQATKRLIIYAGCVDSKCHFEHGPNHEGQQILACLNIQTNEQKRNDMGPNSRDFFLNLRKWAQHSRSLL